jgi:hypothetical protein
MDDSLKAMKERSDRWYGMGDKAIGMIDMHYICKTTSVHATCPVLSEMVHIAAAELTLPKGKDILLYGTEQMRQIAQIITAAHTALDDKVTTKNLGSLIEFDPDKKANKPGVSFGLNTDGTPSETRGSAEWVVYNFASGGSLTLVANWGPLQYESTVNELRTFLRKRTFDYALVGEPHACNKDTVTRLFDPVAGRDDPSKSRWDSCPADNDEHAAKVMSESEDCAAAFPDDNGEQRRCATGSSGWAHKFWSAFRDYGPSNRTSAFKPPCWSTSCADENDKSPSRPALVFDARPTAELLSCAAEPLSGLSGDPANACSGAADVCQDCACASPDLNKQADGSTQCAIVCDTQHNCLQGPALALAKGAIDHIFDAAFGAHQRLALQVGKLPSKQQQQEDPPPPRPRSAAARRRHGQQEPEQPPAAQEPEQPPQQAAQPETKAPDPREPQATAGAQQASGTNATDDDKASNATAAADAASGANGTNATDGTTGQWYEQAEDETAKDADWDEWKSSQSSLASSFAPAAEDPPTAH